MTCRKREMFVGLFQRGGGDFFRGHVPNEVSKDEDDEFLNGGHANALKGAQLDAYLEASGRFFQSLPPSRRGRCRLAGRGNESLPSTGDRSAGFGPHERHARRGQVVIEKPVAHHDLGLSLHGCWPNFDGRVTNELLFPSKLPTHHTPDHIASHVRFPLSLIRDGRNEIVVYNDGKKSKTLRERRENSVCIVSLEVGVMGRQA